MEQYADSDYKLEIDAQVVRQLGDELITDPEQALLELVKNSFDADASWCNITVDTRHTCSLSDIFPIDEEEISKGKKDGAKASQVKVHGRIAVEDSGTGMDAEAIRRGWLTISLSPKRAFKAAGKVTTKYKRTPLGDKGLGRLGSMKLGDYLRITTHSKTQGKGLRITLNWAACKSGVPLSEVPVFSEEVESTGKTGTTLEIFGLRDAAYWAGKTRLQELRAKLSTLISPFKSFDSFVIALKVNDGSVDLISLPQNFLDTAAAHFELLWDNTTLEMSGEVKLGLFRSQQNAALYDEWIAADDGAEFWKFLERYKRTEGLGLKRSKTKKWFIEHTDALKWTEVPLPKQSELFIHKPGPAVAELYSFELDADTSKLPDFLSEIGEYKDIVKSMAGVFVFRNNFRVRMGMDWLKLGESWTSGGSYYGLKPTNTLGYVALTSKDNPDLIEKSDREGFVDNPEWRGLETLGNRFKKYANDLLEELRRAANAFLDEQKQSKASPQSVSVEASVKELSQILSTAKKVSDEWKHSESRRSALMRKAKETLQSLSDDDRLDRKLKEQVRDAVSAVQEVTERVSNESDQMQAILGGLAEKEKHAELISDRFEQLQNQIAEVYETVATGLAAQGLVHEVHPLLDQVNARIQGVKNKLKKEGVKDQSIAAEVETIRSVNGAIAKRVAFINPMLRTFREMKATISVRSFLTDYFSYRAERYERLGITSVVDIPKDGDLVIEMNVGRFTQVIDNVVRNCEYWLEHAKRTSGIKALEIHAEVVGQSLVIWDTGLGVRRRVEQSLFEIFVTDKPKGEGHGLGLFITSRLLESQGCSISLGKERNERGNRYKFVIDLTASVK